MLLDLHRQQDGLPLRLARVAVRGPPVRVGARATAQLPYASTSSPAMGAGASRHEWVTGKSKRDSGEAREGPKRDSGGARSGG
eukprot:6964630-Alexandrium_andersonii.AAC.1